MTIQFIRQPKGSNQCAQHAVAMYTRKDLNDIFKAYGTEKATNMQLTESALRKLNVDFESTMKIDNRKKKMISELENCLIRIEYGNRKLGHLVLKYEGKIYDSGAGVFDGINDMLDYYNNYRQIKTRMTHVIKLHGFND